MFERFLERLSVSEFSEKFVIKGGMLIAAVVGLDTRSTMDLDATLRNLQLTKEQILTAIDSICRIDLNDEVTFKIISAAPIRQDDIYGGYCVKLEATYDMIVTPLAIDISTGDIITPFPIKYEFGGLLDENVRIVLWGYNIETILSRGIFTTRLRDYYDVYILGTTQRYDKNIFKEALRATATHRGTLEKISDTNGIIEQISFNEDLKNMWVKYQKKFAYANDILYENIVEVLSALILDNSLDNLK